MQMIDYQFRPDRALQWGLCTMAVAGLRALAVLLALEFFGAQAMAQDLVNIFGDPFGPATHAIQSCPIPAGPVISEADAKKQAHYRSERGTSCFRSGRCRLPNSYLYDKELFPRAVKLIQSDGRFRDTRIWVTVQRRWVLLEGCVLSKSQGEALESLVRSVDDVEIVIGSWMVGPTGRPPYLLAAPRR